MKIWPLTQLIAMNEGPGLGRGSRGAAAVATKSCAIFQSFGAVRINVKSLKKLILMLMKSFPTLSIIAC